MKTRISLLLLLCFVLHAQTPPPATTNRDGTPNYDLLRQGLRQSVAGDTNVTASEPVVAAAAPALPGGNQAAVPPPVPRPTAPPGPPAPGGAPSAPAAQPPPVGVVAPAPAKTGIAVERAEEILPAGTINFPAVDVNQVLQVYAELVNRTILRPANLPAPLITLKTQTPLTKREAIQAFDTVLAMNGIAIIPVGDKFIKVVPAATAFQEAAAFSKLDPDRLAESGQYVSQIIQLKYISKPSELLPVLTPFAKIPNSIFPLDSSQILVIRDNVENVKRMLEIIKAVDVAVPAEYVSEVIPIKYALASDISSVLGNLGSGGGGTTVGRSGGARGTGAATTPGAGVQGYRPPTTGTPGTPGVMTPLGTPGTPMTPVGAAGATSSFTERLRQIVSRVGAAGEFQILGQTKIIADERTNSLLVFASRQDMEMIKDIISKLDVVMAQVLIEAIIVDVSLSDNFNFGVSASQNPKQFTGNFAGGGGFVNGPKFLDSLFAGTNSSGLFHDALSSGLRYFGTFNDNWDLTLEALASDSRAKIIQRPRIQTSHATPAQLFVGETVPYITSSYYGGFGGQPSANYQQLNVGIGLQVVPFINPDGLVVMRIEQQIDEVSGFQNIGGSDVPTTTSRRFSAEVAVRDRECIILGGFIRNEDTKSRSGVPFLKDIPLLGYLFRSSSDRAGRRELLVLMRPTVLRTPEIATATATAERQRLPGIKRAEAELEAEEAGQAGPAARREPKKYEFQPVDGR